MRSTGISAAKAAASTTYLCKSWSNYTTDIYYLTEKDFKLVLPLFDKLVREFGQYCNGKNKVTAMPYPCGKNGSKKCKSIKIATPKRPKRPTL